MALQKKKKPIAPWRQNILSHHKRGNPKRGDLTKVTPNVRKEVNRRSMELLGATAPVCERCGTTQNLTKAHIVNASQGGPGNDPANIMNLCGTHGMTGTCHHWADNTQDGRRWKEQYGKMLRKYYKAALAAPAINPLTPKGAIKDEGIRIHFRSHAIYQTRITECGVHGGIVSHAQHVHRRILRI